MAKRISEDINEKIRLRLLQKIPISEIVEEFGVSKSHILRIKKDMPLKNKDISNVLSDEHYNTLYSKREEEILNRIGKEIVLFEDKEEGWVYHVTNLNELNKMRGIWWNVIIYPESAPENWQTLLKNMNNACAISPLHDKDVWTHDSDEYIDFKTGKLYKKGERFKAGDRKKAHYHVIIVLEKPASFKEMNGVLQTIFNCPYIQKCRSLKNSYEYFTHINAPEKYQGYSKDEIIKFNNFRIEPNNYEKGLIAQDIVNIIKEKGFDKWHEVVFYFKDDIEYLIQLQVKSAFFIGLVRSIYFENNPNIVKPVEVKQVDKFTYEKELEENGRE